MHNKTNSEATEAKPTNSDPRQTKSVQLEQLAEEYAQRLRDGQRPSLEEYVQRYPELESEIREAFPVMLMIEELAPSTHAEPASAMPAAPQLEGKQLGEYRLIREIGRGGMGIVYEAEQGLLGRRVALKALPSSRRRSKSAVERFHREARAAASLTHQHIVPIYDVNATEDWLYYAMQLIRGHSLDTLIHELRLLQQGDSEPPTNSPAKALATSLCTVDTTSCPDEFPPADATVTSPEFRPDSTIQQQFDETISNTFASESGSPGSMKFFRNVARIGTQVADALAHAHENGVIHRDIKPGNLLLDSLSHVWVTDFGLAKLDESDLTQEGDVLGTLRYMAPEQLRGWADPRSDVYSIGITLYELLVLQPAFGTADRVELLQQVAEETPPNLRTIDRNIPIDLETIVSKAIAKEPADRYQDCVALRDDLQCFIDFCPISARRITAAGKLKRWATRNKILATMMVACLVTLVGWAVTATLHSIESERNLTRLYGATVMGIVDQVFDGTVANIQEHIEEIEGYADAHWELSYLKRLLASSESPRLASQWPIKGITYSPTGEWFASADYFGEVRVWNARDNTLRHMVTLPTPAMDGTRIHASPDGRHLFVRTENGEFYLLDVEDDTFQPILFRADGYSDVSFSYPDGKYLLELCTESREDYRLVAYSVDEIKRTREIVEPAEWEHPFAEQRPHLLQPKDGHLHASVPNARGGYDFVRWDPISKREIDRFPVKNSGPVYFAADRYLTVEQVEENVQANYEQITVWNKSTNTKLWTVTPDVPLYSIAFSPDGKLIAGALGRGEILVYDIATQQKLRLRGHENGVFGGIRFSPDSTKLISASYDQTVRVWDVTIQPDYFEGPSVDEIVLSSDGSLLATNNGAEIHLWKANTLELLRTLQGHAPCIPNDRDRIARMPMAFSPDGKWLASATKQAEILLWDVASGEAKQVFRHSAGGCENIRFLPHAAEPTIVCVFQNSKCESLNLNTGVWRTISHDPGKWLRGLDVSPDGTRAVTAGTLMTPRMIPLGKDAHEQSTLLANQRVTIFHAAFRPDSSQVAVTGKSRMVSVFDVNDESVVASLKGIGADVTGLCFTSDGQRILTTSERTLRVFDPATERLLLALTVDDGQLSGVQATPHGKESTVFTGGDRVRIWDPRPVSNKVHQQRRLHRQAQRIVENLRHQGPRLKEDVRQEITKNEAISKPVKLAALKHLDASGEDVTRLFLAAWEFAFHREKSQLTPYVALKFMDAIDRSMDTQSPEVLNLHGIVLYYNDQLEQSQQVLTMAQEIFAEEEVPEVFQFSLMGRSDLLRDRATNQLFLAMIAQRLGAQDARQQLTDAIDNARNKGQYHWRQVDVLTGVIQQANELLADLNEPPKP